MEGQINAHGEPSAGTGAAEHLMSWTFYALPKSLCVLRLRLRNLGRFGGYRLPDRILNILRNAIKAINEVVHSPQLK